MKKYSVLDLFAGAGGLSLGFVQTGRFSIAAAAENNRNAQNTYKKNHPSVDIKNDVREIDYLEILKKHGQIDVVVGGPPCQGFSNANRQKAQAISTNNSLVKEFVRAVRELRPRVFVMENVGMLRSASHRFYYSNNDKTLIDSLDIELREDKFLLLPLSFCGQQASAIAKTLNHYCDYLWSEADFSVINILYRQRNNTSKMKLTAEKYEKKLVKCADHLLERCRNNKEYVLCEDERLLAAAIKRYFDTDGAEADMLIQILETPLMTQKMYRHYQELIENEIIIDGIGTDDGIYASVHSYPVFEYIKSALEAEPYNYRITSKVLNAADYGVPQKRERYIIIGTNGSKPPSLPEPIIQSDDYRTVSDAIADLESINTTTEIMDKPVPYTPVHEINNSPLASLRNSQLIYNHVVTATQKTAMERYKALKQGENFHNLNDKMKSTYTDVKRTQNTIYLRLKYDEPSGTVINVRKSMWIHPVLNRALSIREAARLQTFPDSFVFTGTKDSQYQQVGNAVPPMLANAVAEHVLGILDGMKDG